MQRQKTVLHSRNTSVNNSTIDGNTLFIQLREKIREEGIFDRDYRYYSILTVIMVSGFISSIIFLFLVNNPFLLFFSCILFSFFSVQLAGIVHDAGHRAIFSSALANDIAGYIFGIMLGWAYTPWRSAHNKHHAYTNQKDKDPDLEVPVFTFTTEHFDKRGKTQQFLIRYQVYLYFPFGCFAAALMKISGFITLLHSDKKNKLIEEISIGLSLFMWYIAPFFLFGIGKALFIIIVINLVTGFYIFNIFAPNHKGMPQLSADKEISFMERQIMTSRNIVGSWFNDILYMGLNYQVEHHLFPSVARNKLKLTSPYILQICQQRNIEFTRVSILESNRIILSELKNVSMAISKL